MKPMTDRQQIVLEFVEEFCARQGYPPTVREVAARFGIQPRAAVDHLEALKRKGQLHREPGLLPGAVPGAPSPGGGRSAAAGPDRRGPTLTGRENVEETLPLPRSWVRDQEVFLLKVAGESMAPVLLPDDLVMVRVQARVARGEIAVVLVDDEATLKRVFEEAGGLVLKGDNPDFTPLRISPTEAAEVQILGKVVGVYRNLEGKRHG